MLSASAALLVLAVAAPPERIVTLGGSVTETVFALGYGDRVVGVDGTSRYPASVNKLARLGFYKAVSPEGLLALTPDLVIALKGAGPPPAFTALEAAGVQVVFVEPAKDLAGALARLATLGRVLGREARATELANQLREGTMRAKAITKAKAAPRVLFIYARGNGSLMVAGRKTGANAMVTLAGGTPAVDGYEGYRPLTSEALVAAAPDILLLTSHGHRSLGGDEGLLGVPGVSLTPAGKKRRIVVLDDNLLLGFGPRTGLAAVKLAEAFFGGEG